MIYETIQNETIQSGVCIGGPLDGAYRQAKGDSFKAIRQPPFAPISLVHLDPRADWLQVEEFVYVYHTIAGAGIWIVAGTVNTAIRSLLDCYQAHVQKAKAADKHNAWRDMKAEEKATILGGADFEHYEDSYNGQPGSASPPAGSPRR